MNTAYSGNDQAAVGHIVSDVGWRGAPAPDKEAETTAKAWA